MKGGTPDSEIKFPIFLAWANRQAEREQSIHEIDKQILVAGRLLADTGIPAEEQREQSIRDIEKQIADRLADTGISAEERRSQELGAWSLAQKKVAIPDGGPGEVGTRPGGKDGAHRDGGLHRGLHRHLGPVPALRRLAG